jgi:hypothetical protein
MKPQFPKPKTGEVIEVLFPFYHPRCMIGDGYTEAWQAGCLMEEDAYDRGIIHQVAHGMGHQILTVVATFKPPAYPERVFFRISYRNPTGELFRKRDLKCFTVAGFTRLRKGWKTEYILDTVPK